MALNTNIMVLVFGVRRSGNHLISDWILHQYMNPCFQAMNVQLDFFSFLEDFKTDCEFYNCSLFGIEEHPVQAIDIAYAKNAVKITKVILLRDPYNLFASRIKSYHLFDAPYFNGDFVTYNWIDYAKYFLNPSDGVICISYNDFVRDKDYRIGISKELGIGFKEDMDSKYINKVDKSISEGSSFDRDQFDGKGNQMQVSSRWEHFKDKEEYRALFTDEIKGLSKEIFDYNPF